MAGRITGGASAPPVSSSVRKTLAASNVNHDRSLVLRAPRIRALNTRNYGKGVENPYPDQNQTNYGTDVGYGPKEP